MDNYIRDFNIEEIATIEASTILELKKYLKKNKTRIFLQYFIQT